jgi:hypothetical protein
MLAFGFPQLWRRASLRLRPSRGGSPLECALGTGDGGWPQITHPVSVPQRAVRIEKTARAIWAILYNVQNRIDIPRPKRKLHSEGYAALMGMEEFVHKQNLGCYRKMLSEKTYEQHRPQILKMLAEEAAKDHPPTDSVDRNPPVPVYVSIARVA